MIVRSNQLDTVVLSIGGILRQAVAVVVIILVLISANGLEAAEPPSALALLRGVESIRTEHDSLKATIEVRYVSPAPAKAINGMIELDRDRRRFEVFAGEVVGQIIIRDGDEFHGFRRKEHEDVEVYDVRRATGIRGDLVFDPRILGLSDFMPCDLTVDTCLWLNDFDEMQVVGQGSLHGVNVWRVKVGRKNSDAEFWIEEPSFRVHRKTVESPSTHIEINSEFDSSKPSSPFPSRVVAKRDEKQSGGVGFERIYIIKSFDLGADIPAERFTLKSMDLPVNTMINDYRISQIVGYWNGEGISQNPVYEGERPAKVSAPESQAKWRLLVIAFNVIVAVFLATAIYWKRR